MIELIYSEKVPPQSLWENYNVVIIDKNVRGLYYELEDNFIEIVPEERNKSLSTVREVWNFFFQKDIDRHSKIAIVGGGLTLDVGAFASSTWMRGTKYHFFPTTLLAQVDAAIGGKTAINYNNVKNLIGTFYNPEKIFIHYDFLKTLQKKQIRSGFAEMVKHFLLKNKKLFNEVLNITPYRLEELTNYIKPAVNIKLDIVSRDFKEKNLRKILNLGHTFGHALEILYSIEHGEAIALGTLIELFFSIKLLNFPENVWKNLYNLYELWKFPLDLINKIDIDELLPYMLKDKKKKNKILTIIGLKDVEHPCYLEFMF